MDDFRIGHRVVGVVTVDHRLTGTSTEKSIVGTVGESEFGLGGSVIVDDEWHVWHWSYFDSVVKCEDMEASDGE